MARNLMQDIVMPKKSIRKILPLPPKRETLQKLEPKVSVRELKKEEERPAFKYPSRGNRKNFSWLKKPVVWWSLLAVAVSLLAIFFLGIFFSGANIEITPKSAEFDVNTPLIASKSTSGGIPFEIIIIKGSESKSVVATGAKQVERKASGRIVLYNNYGSAPQKLVKNTRFQAANGKIYRISSEITVPGMSQKNGVSTPGSVEITVYADQPGPAYNTGLTDFTIPGFKGDPRYSKFYGRSKTEITGGFSGNAPVARDADLATARLAIEASLKVDLLREAISQVPSGYVLYKNAVQYSFEGAKDVSKNITEVTQSEDGSLVGVLLKKDDLSRVLSKNISLEAKDQTPFILDSMDVLTFAFKGGVSAIDANTKDVPFSLSGKVSVTYTVDKEALSKDMSGKAKEDFQTILQNYPSVYKAKIISIKPFWTRYFPVSPEKITITLAK